MGNYISDCESCGKKSRVANHLLGSGGRIEMPLLEVWFEGQEPSIAGVEAVMERRAVSGTIVSDRYYISNEVS